MNTDDVRNIAQTVQAVLIGIGVIVGGLWALFRIRVYGEVEAAKAQLEKLRHDLAVRKGISGSLHIEVHQNDNGTYAIIVEARLENSGSNMYHLNFDNSPFRFCKVIAEESQRYSVVEIQRRDVFGASLEGAPYTRVIGQDLMPGTVKGFPACFEAPTKGIYLVSFVFETPLSIQRYDYDNVEHNIAVERAKEISEKKWYTRVEKLVYVGSSETEASPDPGRVASY